MLATGGGGGKNPDFLFQPEYSARTSIGRKTKMEKAQLQLIVDKIAQVDKDLNLIGSKASLRSEKLDNKVQ